MTSTLPPWAAEDHACPDCGFAFADTDVADVPQALRAVAADVRRLVSGLTPEQLTRRPDTGTWSVIEYLCHVRDVCESSTIRLHRARVEDHPRIEAMYNDLRATRFRYAERGAANVLDELDSAVAGCSDEIARVRDWDRTVFRRPGEERTARWLARAAVHEGRHHLLDMQRLATG